jgi:hypothetical protein
MMAAISTSQSSLVEPRLLHVVGAAQRGVGLQEEDRLGWDRAGLLGVIDVVQADGGEFRDAGHRRADPWLAADRRKLGGSRAASLASAAGA